MLQHYMYLINHIKIFVCCRRGSDRMVVGFTTICAISAYHHRGCDFESRTWWRDVNNKIKNKKIRIPRYRKNPKIKYQNYRNQIDLCIVFLELSPLEQWKNIFNTEPQVLQKTLSSNQVSILVTGFHLFRSFLFLRLSPICR
jgi:Iap family predicted aminopeptidase